jgi:uncharacterized protein with NRDE domain
MTTSIACESPMAMAKGEEGESNIRNSRVHTEYWQTWQTSNRGLANSVPVLRLLNKENHYTTLHSLWVYFVGFLVTDFISAELDTQTYLTQIDKEKLDYNGFHLVLMEKR